tara:strand:+ start:1307 stop:1516 length:210 start_codon:yes stop_codon:yes gene_type:complete
MEMTATAAGSNVSWFSFGVGSTLYTNSSCSSYASSGWWPVSGSSSFSADKVVYVGAGGVVTSVYTCSQW